MDYTYDQLNDAKFQIDSTIHKLIETKKTLVTKPNSNRYVSQITLASRRIEAFQIALNLINEKLNNL